ncbi:MAG TPA: biotin/lipoyl-containing protein [Steroidobacteraceae bacterium]|nr:biotin/lipoyl-containing protein [Steroidobacteraceae bacterium]
MSFDIDDVMEVLKIIRECKDTELHIDTGDLKLSLVKGNVRSSGAGFFSPGAPAQNPPPMIAPVAAAEPVEAPAAPVAHPRKAASDKPDPKPKAEVASDEGLVPVTANVTSVFYRKPSPEEPPFVEVGDVVEEDTVVCLLEVMKCFRQVMAGTRGVVEKICAESNHLVEQGSVLFLIRPE